MIAKILKLFAGSHYKRFYKKARPIVAKINKIEEQYQSLVVTKPAPVSLAKVEIDSSESDVPLFAPVDSDEDQPAVSDQETLTDAEINLYARNL